MHSISLASTTIITKMKEDEGRRLLVLGAKDVDDILKRITIDDLVNSQRDVFATFSTADKTKWESPLRLSVGTSKHVHLFMPSRREEATAIKCVAVPKANVGAPPGLPATGLFFDADEGKANVVVNVSQLTAVRTAAGCVAASVAMQPSKQMYTNGVVVVFGAGNQARWHARLFVHRYGLARVVVVTTNASAKVSTIVPLWSTEIGAQASIEVIQQGSEEMYASLRQADFVCCCTPSTSALFDWSKAEFVPHVHFSLIGSYKPHMQEVPPEAVEKSASVGALTVDSIEACTHEAGDLLKSSAKPEQWKEIGQIVGRKTSDTYDVSDKFSMFKSVGFALQDLAIIQLVVQYARVEGIGQLVDFF